jgi:TatD DNase family protein
MRVPIIDKLKLQKMNNNFLVDSHCHLDLLADKGFNIDEIIENAVQNQVQILQTIGTKISNFEQVYQYAQKYHNVFASVGIHPCNVEEEPKITAEEIIKIYQTHPKIIGIGETGLDYFHPNFIPENQIASFIEHITAARELDLPVIIHTRDADSDMAKILESEMKKGQFKALLHCFSSSKELALKAVELGISISISGIITFKNAVDLQNIVKDLPLESLLVETDAPYLAPMPHRGKPNQPAFTKHTAEFLANLKGVSFEEICQITTGNFLKLFNNPNAAIPMKIGIRS